ncbi:hypothetical protein [Actinomarinicola tropica]|uniref:Uncharacterized protein n=1 Tax=Actinomarinicola tropica TaxID=2789776 RepID=A0A5Q2RHG1_9ACTN|nr:hypothetical protein [Actinomarinicola tropica]QGG96279.1 hypothetical protein GH723_14880 [Actinomarinicola tropica]
MRFVFAAGLMVVCAGGIGRLLWLLEGKPPLDRPAWWPARRSIETSAGRPTSSSSADCHSVASGPRRRGRLAAVGACAACCGIPVLLLAGIAVFGVVASVSFLGALLLLAGLAAWRLTARRVRSHHHKSSASTGMGVSCCGTTDGDRNPEAELASAGRHG